LLSRLPPYAEEITVDHQCGSHHHKSTTDHIPYIHHIVEKKLEYKEAAHQLFTDFKKAYDSVKRELLYNSLIEFGIPMKLARLIKMYLNETYSKFWVGKHLCDIFPTRDVLKQAHALLPLLFNFALEYAIRKV
jgi:hypothetical protein